MQTFEEKKLFDALRGAIDYPLPAMNREMDELALADLKEIIPVVDDLLHQAEIRGKFSVYLEVAYKELSR